MHITDEVLEVSLTTQQFSTLLRTGKENGLVDFSVLKLISVKVGSY